MVRARVAMHGKTSPVFHQDQGVFEGLANPLTVTRYHSLVVRRESLPDCLEITAWTQLEDGSVDEIMGLRHKTLNVEGVQFHPESILTQQGHELLANFLKAERRRALMDIKGSPQPGGQPAGPVHRRDAGRDAIRSSPASAATRRSAPS